MRDARDVILKPIITENSMEGVRNGKYTFKVLKAANKIEIANAVEKQFGVTVDSVNTMNVRGRFKRMGRNEGYKPDWKKAIVTLKQGSKTIEFFESMI